MAHWDSAQGQARWPKWHKNTPTCDVPPRKPQTQKKRRFFFDVN